MVKLKYYAKAYYRSTYRRKFNYQIFGDMYCFSFKDRLKKVLENPVWYIKIFFGKERTRICNYFINYLKFKYGKILKMDLAYN
jgi:hypothetical protein